jgi:uncharacterized RDD family membrane protein YckC
VPSTQHPLDLTATIRTPENIQFEYRLAGPFRRLPALVIDFVVRMMLIAAIYTVVVLFAGFFGFVAGAGSIADFGFFLAMVADFLLMWFYGAFFETYWNGQTPGKWASRIRVMSVDGRPVNGFQATVRNLLRPADFIVGILFMLFTERLQRLGDLAAGTMVVSNERSWVPTKVKLEDPRIRSLSEYIPPGFRLTPTLAKAIALYAERRLRIPVGRRMELAQTLAAPLLKRFDFRDDTSPDLLLCAIYYREFVCKDLFASEKIDRGTLKSSSPIDRTVGDGSLGVAAVPLVKEPAQSPFNQHATSLTGGS